MGLLKYAIGDKVLVSATILSARVIGTPGNEKVVYFTDEYRVPIPEEYIVGYKNTNKVYVDVELQREEFDRLKDEAEELNNLLERARSIMNDLAHKNVDINVKLGAITSGTQPEADVHNKGSEIRLSELSNLFRIQDK